MSDTTNADAEVSAQVSNDQSAVPGAKRRMDPSFKRNLTIIGGVFGVAIIGIVGMIAMKSGNQEVDQGSVGLVVSQSTISNAGGEEISPAMREALRQKMEADQKKAAAAGQAVFIPSETLDAPQQIKPDVTPLDITGNGQYGVTADAPPPPLTQSELERLQRRRAGLERQAGSLMELVKPAAGNPVRVVFASTDKPSNPAGVTAVTSEASTTGTATTAKPAPILIQALDILAAETASPIDTYKTKYVSARVVAGKFNGAFLTGTSAQSEDGLSLSFTMMKFGGQTYVIDATGLDEKTSTDAMNAEVDRRYLQRYVIPVASAAFGAAANAFATVGSQQTSNPSGVTVSTPAPTSEQARAAGLAAGASIISAQVAKEAEKPYQIKMAANTPIGIMFRKPVTQIAQQ